MESFTLERIPTKVDDKEYFTTITGSKVKPMEPLITVYTDDTYKDKIGNFMIYGIVINKNELEPKIRQFIQSVEDEKLAAFKKNLKESSQHASTITKIKPQFNLLNTEQSDKKGK